MRRRLAPLAPLALALAVFLALRAQAAFAVDDAFIAFRYARNWATLGVPTFNPGHGAPVEGYSNALWVALLALGERLGFAAPRTAEALGLVAGAATLVLFSRVVRRGAGLTGVPHAVALLLLATFPPFVVWSSGGLETALFTLLALGLYATLAADDDSELRRGLVGGVLALGVALVRVEGFLWVLALGAAAAAARGRRARRDPIALAVYLAGFVAFLLWRHGLYGAWLANTAGAKGGVALERFARGAKGLASALLALGSPVAGLIAAGFALRAGNRPERRRAALGALGVCAAFAGFHVLVGGDWMPFWRFLAPAAPFLALLLALGIASLRSARQAAFVGAVLVAVQPLALFDVSLAPRSWLAALSFRSFRGAWQSEAERLATARRNGAEFEALGRALAAATAPGEGLVFGAIGAVGWHAPELVLHDRNGLVDREVAALGGALGTGSDTAGHDRRVPRAWFLSRFEPAPPTYFHAALVGPGPAGPVVGPNSAALDGPLPAAFAAAVRSAMLGQVLAQPGEEALLRETLVEARAVSVSGVPEGSALLLWTRAPDARTAARFWARVGLPQEQAPPPRR